MTSVQRAAGEQHRRLAAPQGIPGRRPQALEQLALEIGQKAAKVKDSQAHVAESSSRWRDMYRQIEGLKREIERNETDYAAIDAKAPGKRREDLESRTGATRPWNSSGAGARAEPAPTSSANTSPAAGRPLSDAFCRTQLSSRPCGRVGRVRRRLRILKRWRPNSAVSAPRSRASGDVNLGAIKEYQQLQERHAFLQAQRADLEKAIDDLHQVIHKINTVSQERFMQTFRAINAKLAEVFPGCSTAAAPSWS